MTQPGSGHRKLIELFTGLLDGSLDRHTVQAWARAKGSPGAPPHAVDGVAEQEAFYALTVAAERAQGAWFLDADALSLWLALLREHPREWPLRDGWVRAPHTPWPRRSGISLGWFEPVSGRSAAAELGTPVKSWWELDKYEQWMLRAPGGQRFALHRYVPSHLEEAGVDFDVFVCAEDWDLPERERGEAAIRLLDHIIGLRVPAWATEEALIRPQWSLWRTDDNGLDFRVSDHLTEASAERACERRGRTTHKQWFWVDRA